MSRAPADEPSPAPQKGGYYKDDGPGDNSPAGLAAIPDAVPRAEPLHRYANRPYEVFGKTYVPLAELRPYRETGIGSWYGRRFHGAPTSSGEPYDMYAMTAAHPTLPIPSYARVTNPANGRSVVVRINDRGPFHAGRIIDLSYAAAYKLGFMQAGSARVELESIVPGEASIAAVPPPSPRAEEADTPQPASGVYLQLGAFAGRENAESFRVRLARELGSLADGLRLIGSGGVFRLHLGPYRSREEARPVAERIRSQLSLEPLFVAR